MKLYNFKNNQEEKLVSEAVKRSSWIWLTKEKEDAFIEKFNILVVNLMYYLYSFVVKYSQGFVFRNKSLRISGSFQKHFKLF